MAWRDEVLAFWFALEPAQWWKADPALDAEIRERFLPTWESARQCPAETFLYSPRAAVAAVILFDQFPRNMFRGHADQFSTDALALAVARGAVERELDEHLDGNMRVFLYMPFQHSEGLEDQKHSLALFTALGDDYHLGYAKKHHDVIERFGRFPHRNAILGRPPRPDEIEAGDVTPF
jgi:uncharacterized protein (DUF924 family)